MENGLVNIEFTGIATAYFATSAKVRADILELKKMGSEIGLGGIGGGVGGAGSVESQLAPVRAASQARRAIYTEEADAYRALVAAREKMYSSEGVSYEAFQDAMYARTLKTESGITEVVSAQGKKRVLVREEQLAEWNKLQSASNAELSGFTKAWEAELDQEIAVAKLNADSLVEIEAKKAARLAAIHREELAEMEANRAALNSRIQGSVRDDWFAKNEGLSVPWSPPRSAAEQNIEESRRAGGGMPLVLPNVPRGTENAAMGIEEELRGGGRGKNWISGHPFVASRIGRESMGALDLSAGDIGGSFGNIGQGAMGIAPWLSNPYAMGALAIGGVGAIGIGETISKGGKFEMSEARLRAGTQMSQKAAEAFRRVAMAQSELAGNTPESSATNFEEAARTLLFALHISGEDVDKNLPQLLAMMNTVREYATAMGIPVNEAARDLVTKFNLSGGKVEGQKNAAANFSHIADIFAMATTRGALQPEDLGAAIRKTGGVAAFEGVPTPDLLAGLEIMGTSGDKGQVIGTAMRQYMLSLGGAKMSPKLGKELTGAGLSMKDISIARKSLPDAIQVLKDHMSGMQPEQRNALLKDLFGQRWESFYQQMSTNLPEFRKISSEIRDQSGGSVARMAGTMEDTMQFKEGKIGKEFTNMFIKAFTDNEADFKKLADDIIRLLEEAQKFEPVFATVVDMIVKLMDAALKFANFTTGPTPDNPIMAGLQVGIDAAVPVLGGVKLMRDHQRAKEEQKKHENETAPPIPGGSHIEQLKANVQPFPGNADEFTDKGGLYSGNDFAQAVHDFYSESPPDHNKYETTADYQLALKYWKSRKKFNSGGFTGNHPDDQPVGFVHGGEVVIDAQTVRSAGLGNIMSYYQSLKGYGDGGYTVPNPYGAMIAAQPSETDDQQHQRMFSEYAKWKKKNPSGTFGQWQDKTSGGLKDAGALDPINYIGGASSAIKTGIEHGVLAGATEFVKDTAKDKIIDGLIDSGSNSSGVATRTPISVAGTNAVRIPSGYRFGGHVLRGYNTGNYVDPQDYYSQPSDPAGLPTVALPDGTPGSDDPSLLSKLSTMFTSEGGMNRVADLIHGKETPEKLWGQASAGGVASGIAGFAQSGQFQSVLKGLGASKGLQNFTSGNTLSDISSIISMGTKGPAPRVHISLAGEDAYGKVNNPETSAWIAKAHKALNPSAANIIGDITSHAAPFADIIAPGSGQIMSQLGNVLGSFATGTPFVPKTGLYQLHEGEKVTPAGSNGISRLHPDDINALAAAMSNVHLGIEPTSIRTGLAQGNNSFNTWD